MASYKHSVTDDRSQTTTPAEAALTHPATLIALATLFVNEGAFKSIWSRSWITGVNTATTKVKFSLFAAALACLASIGSSCGPPDTGVSVLSENQSGNVVAKDFIHHYYWGVSFRSLDGGLTWERVAHDLLTDDSIDWHAPTAHAPGGTYSLEGSDVVLTTDGVPRIVHSTFNVNRNAAYRIFALTTDSTGGGVTHLPTDIHYHAASGNLIVAMGLQGVLVRTPDGIWQRIGVGNYKPIDFSIANRARLLTTGEELGFLFMAITIASLGFALTKSTLPPVPGNRRYVKAISAGSVATVLAAVLIVLVSYLGIGPFLEFIGFSGSFVGLITFLSVPLSVFVFVALMVFVAKAFGIQYGDLVRSVLALMLFLASLVPLFYYDEADTFADGAAVVRGLVAIILGLCALVFVIVALVKTRSSRVFFGTILTATSMMLAANFVFMLWLSGFIDLLPAKIATVLLVWSIAFMLYKYVTRKSVNEPTTQDDQPPTGQAKRTQPVYPVRLSKNAKDN